MPSTAVDVVRLFRRALRASFRIEDPPCRRKTILNVRTAFRLHQGVEYANVRDELVAGGRAAIALLEACAYAPLETQRMLFRKRSAGPLTPPGN